MIHDARCTLDYLQTRADVDADRIGVTGASGGGIQTLYLAVLDDRITAAAPCCSVTTRREWLKTGKQIDAEQLVYGAIPIPGWVEDYYGIYGTEFKLAYDALLLGTSLLGMRL